MINFDFEPSYQVSKKKKEYSKFIIPAALYYSNIPKQNIAVQTSNWSETTRIRSTIFMHILMCQNISVL